jgi:hypothetical protein
MLAAAKAGEGGRSLAKGFARFGAFADSVEHTAATAAPEDHGVGAFMHFHPLNVVEAAEILNVIAQAIDEKICGRIIAAQRDLIAVPLTLTSGDAGDMAHKIGNRHDRLILDLLFSHHADGLWHIKNRG